MYVPDLDVTAQEYTDAMTLSGTKVEGRKTGCRSGQDRDRKIEKKKNILMQIN